MDKVNLSVISILIGFIIGIIFAYFGSPLIAVLCQITFIILSLWIINRNVDKTSEDEE